jgi:hypothetical protein
MAVSGRTRTIVWSKAGARCAIAGCRLALITDPESEGGPHLLGELAHIVAQQPDGPRGRKSPPGGEIDGPSNLVLLCPTHHAEIDASPIAYPVERLVQIKEDHERWVASTLSPSQRLLRIKTPEANVVEQLHSTVLPVLGYPRYVYAGTCDLTEREAAPQIQRGATRTAMLPFIIRNRQLFTFCNLRLADHPFAKVIEPGSIERHESSDWWGNDDLLRWYVDLLNRSLNKLTGRLGLMLDREHKRYYFGCDGQQSRSVAYRSLTGRRATRLVAWRPTFKHSGEPRNYWEHMAVGLMFHRVGSRAWVLSIRPERRFTRDGIEAVASRTTGRRATSRKARMYNEGLLTEVNFWREYLSGGRPRIRLDFGDQSLMIATKLLSMSLDWPGVPDDAKPFTHIEYEEDLFTSAELAEFEDEETAS